MQTLVDDVAGHESLEFRTSDEEDEGMKVVRWKAEKLHQSLHMEMVLMKRVLKSILGPVNLLGPLALLFGPKDPALVVFRLNHEDAEGRNNDVIELGSALSIWAGQVEIVELPVELRIQPIQVSVDYPLADPAFERDRNEEFDQDVGAQQQAEDWPIGKERTKELLRCHSCTMPDR